MEYGNNRVNIEVKKMNDYMQQQVSYLFHRNRVFMMKNNIIPPKGNKANYNKKVMNGELTNESLQNFKNLNRSLNINTAQSKNRYQTSGDGGKEQQTQIKSYLYLDEPSQEQYQQKLHELLSTQESFSKYFISSDQKINKQIQMDCDKQKQRLMYGAVNQSKDKQIFKKKLSSEQLISRSFSQEKSLNSQQNIFDNHQTHQNNYTNSDIKGNSVQYERPKKFSIHQDSILYPKSPTVSFDLYSKRRDLFQTSKTDKNSNEYRFNNFFMKKPDQVHTIDIGKQTNRKYDIFQCQMSEIKYDNVCEIYQKNKFNNLLTKCLVDYNREEKEIERVYHNQSKDIPSTDLEVENIIKGIEVTSPFRRAHSPNIKKSLGREKNGNFYQNQPFASNRDQRSQSSSRRNGSASRGQLQIQVQGDSLRQSVNFNRAQTSKRKQSINFKDGKEDKQRKTSTVMGSNNENIKQNQPFVSKRNPLSLFREKRRKIHKLLNIDD